jgi:hypothetical protein
MDRNYNDSNLLKKAVLSAMGVKNVCWEVNTILSLRKATLLN